MYEVFINHHSLILSNSKAKTSYTEIDFNDGFQWSDIHTKMTDENALKLWVKSDDIDSAWRSFKSEYELIIAAGGLVQKNESYLFIYRNGKWDLPKGKLEINEDIAECAVREVEEECGIEDLAIESKLILTYHTYPIKDKMILKETHWYLMKTDYSKAFTPQLEEGIENVEWKRKEDIPLLMKESFASIQKVIDSAKIKG